jgi:hypothetical protein
MAAAEVNIVLMVALLVIIILILAFSGAFVHLVKRPLPEKEAMKLERRENIRKRRDERRGEKPKPKPKGRGPRDPKALISELTDSLEERQIVDYELQERNRMVSEVQRKTDELANRRERTEKTIKELEEKIEAHKKHPERGFTDEQQKILDTFDRTMDVMDASVTDENKSTYSYRLYRLRLKRKDLERALRENDDAWIRDVFLQVRETLEDMQKSKKLPA